ncbi:MAG TPA: YbaB/EbfC family nucleoid-associated protein [Candidatus Onthoplasma faecipullorum]|nr:YbaB/EbfC family nucleoid-associated protein [Candidatus Onthoplasma faecipullorum]
MAYGHGGFGGGMNMNALMQQAKKMQEQMMKAQEELENAEIVGKAGGEMVTVVMNGKKEIKSIKLDKSAVDPDDVEMLEDLIIVAIKDASEKADAIAKDKMGPMGGLM